MHSHPLLCEEGKKIGVDNGVDIEVNIKWDDAPAGFKVRGKSICGEEQRLTIEEFNSTYEVVKKEKPAIVIGDF